MKPKPKIKMIELTQTKSSGAWENPEAGEHKAVCVDVVLNKNEQTNFGEKDMIYLFFELEAENSQGRRHIVRYRATASLNPKANLCRFMQKWRDKRINDGESINFKSLIGLGATLELELEEANDGKIWCNIERARKLDESETPTPDGKYDGDFVRQGISDRNPGSEIVESTVAKPAKKASPPKKKVNASSASDEDDVPF